MARHCSRLTWGSIPSSSSISIGFSLLQDFELLPNSSVLLSNRVWFLLNSSMLLSNLVWFLLSSSPHNLLLSNQLRRR
jgi:hypothetical protein